MATQAQIEANRRNALKSSGPRTPDGKSASARNAVKHGLTAKDLVIPPGQQSEFDQLTAGLRDHLNPQGTLETVLFQQILTAAWRLIRCDRVEAELCARTTEPDPLLDPKLQPTLRTLASTRSQALRQQRQATAELRALQTERIYRQEMLPAEIEPNEAGIATLRTLLHKLRHEQEQLFLSAINAPPPARKYVEKTNPPELKLGGMDPKEIDELDRRALRLLQQNSPELIPHYFPGVTAA